MMKKVLFLLLAACCIYAAWDYSRPVDKYVVKTIAGKGTLQPGDVVLVPIEVRR